MRACSFCLKNTKYTCLYAVVSVFESDEDAPEWKLGSAVSYCEVCFREKMEIKTMRERLGMTEGATGASRNSSSKDKPNVMGERGGEGGGEGGGGGSVNSLRDYHARVLAVLIVLLLHFYSHESFEERPYLKYKIGSLKISFGNG